MKNKIKNSCIYLTTACFAVALFLFCFHFADAQANQVILDTPLASCDNSDTEIILNWTSTVTGNPSFYVQRKVEGEAVFSEIADLGTGVYSWTDNTADSDKNYVYRIRADRGSDFFSNEETVLALYCPQTLDPATANCQADGPHINLAWNQISGDVDRYEIYRKVEGEAGFSLFDSVADTESTYSDGPNITPRLDYEYYIKGVWSDATEADSGQTLTQPLYCPTTLIAVESCLTASAPGGPSVDLNWNSLTGATGFQIYRDVRGGGDEHLIDLDSATVNYTDNLVTSLPTSYFQSGTVDYYVKALWSGEQRDSTTQQIDIPTCAPYLTLENICGETFGSDPDRIHLSWQATQPNNQYNVFNIEGLDLFPIQTEPNILFYDHWFTSEDWDEVSDDCYGHVCSYSYYVQDASNSNNSNTETSNLDCSASAPAPAPAPVLSAPTASCNNGNPQIALTWVASNNVNYYTVNRDGVTIDFLGTSFTDGGLETDVSYNYSLVAVGPGGTTPAVDNYDITSQICTPLSTTTLNLSTACDVGQPVINLSWSNAGDNVVRYDIYRGLTAGEADTNLLIS
ncbi:MAG: hypothetical protein ABIA02_03015, partial [Candidatus Falkowbacteria bacterium]